MALIINFFGAPGVGKSTLAASVFARMKARKLSVEYVSEFAKEKVWESNFKALECQPYITSTQLFYIQRLVEQVDYIITDSPVLLGAVYNKNYPESYNNFLVDAHNMYRCKNILLRKVSEEYENTGRRHSQHESYEIEKSIIELLLNNNIQYHEVNQYQINIDNLIDNIILKEENV